MPGIGFVVFAEQRKGKIKKSAYEAIGAAKELARRFPEPVIAVLAGHRVNDRAEDLFRHGADEVCVLDDPLLEPYTPEAYAAALCPFLSDRGPRAVLMGATAMGKDLAPRVAARLKTGLLSDCIALQITGEGFLTATRPMYGGKIHGEFRSRTPRLQVATLRPNVFPVPPPGEHGLKQGQAAQWSPAKIRARVKEIQASGGATVELTEASIIVSGGRGLKGPENFRLVEELAAALGAAVGASRAAVDAGWKPHPYQVGLTGKTVSPLLYIACGISGAVQHQAGMSSSKFIVGINKDKEAPIFKIANYGIVGDLFEVIPLLTEEVKKMRAE